uniref:Homeobox domain-containing protein n=1 Tax=Tetranychus urticae TaxID=32264 RepID=T1K4J1_TETUR
MKGHNGLLSRETKPYNCNNRGPRIPFTSHQVQILEKKFASTSYLSSYEVWSLSEQLNISENRVKIWFQNRRARRKREERLPDEVDKQISNDLIATDCEQYLPRSPK